MLGIEGYGSDSDNEVETSCSAPFLNLPPPKKAGQASTTAKPAKSKKIITLPPLKAATDDDDLKDERPPAKKPRLENGAGSSSLPSMLPAPKQKNPVKPPQLERVLGGGSSRALAFAPSPAVEAEEQPVVVPESGGEDAGPSMLFRPTSLAKGRKNISLDREPSKPSVSVSAALPVDGSEEAPFAAPSSSRLTASSISLPKVSSAPDVPTFEVPEPTPTDEYPGYYQLPSGQWAAHDSVYYQKFVQKWQREYDAHVRALEKGKAKGFENYEQETTEEIDAQKELERSKAVVKDSEDRKNLTQGAGDGPKVPKMKITASKQSGIARSRHQLSTLLMEAYQNREALEERIAEGRRNRKEAGNKYGF